MFFVIDALKNLEDEEEIYTLASLTNSNNDCTTSIKEHYFTRKNHLSSFSSSNSDQILITQLINLTTFKTTNTEKNSQFKKIKKSKHFNGKSSCNLLMNY